MTLAQLTSVKSEIVVSVIVTLVFVLGFYFAARSAWGKRIQVDARTATAEQFVTPEICEKNHETLCVRIKALEEQAIEGVERRRKIYEEVAKVAANSRADMNQLRVEFDDKLDRQMNRLHDRLDKLPSQIIADLRNTGAIH